jgi:hypothetical protein
MLLPFAALWLATSLIITAWWSRPVRRHVG